MKALVGLAAVVAVALVAWLLLGGGPDPAATPPSPEGTPGRGSPALLAGDRGGTGKATSETDAASVPSGSTGPHRALAPPTYGGRVVDAQGAGVPGATVSLHFWLATFRDDEYTNTVHHVFEREREQQDAPKVRTDEQGYFEIDRPRATQGHLRVEAKGFATAVVHAISGAFQEVVVRREEQMRVRVVDPDGASVRSAIVRLLGPETLDGAHFTSRVPVAMATTDATGTVTLPRVRSASMQLEAVPADPALGVAVQDVDAKSAQDVVLIHVPRVEVVTRTIQDATTGRPIADAYVDILHDHTDLPLQRWRRRVEANARGVVRFPRQSGYETAWAGAPGYMVGSTDKDPIRLVRSTRVVGRVVDPEGAPVAGAAIGVLVYGGYQVRLQAGLPEYAAWTDKDGRFELEIRCAPRSEQPDLGVRSLLVLHADHPPTVHDGIDVAPGTTHNVTIHIQKPAALAFELVDAAGKPLAKRSVFLSRPIPRASTWARGRASDETQPIHLRKQWTRWMTDAKGRCLLEGLPAGPTVVRVENTTARVDLRPGTTHDLRMVFGGGDAIEGVVLNAKGEPVRGTKVSLSGSRAAVARTNAHGLFRFADLPSGRYSVSVPATKEVPGAHMRAQPGEMVMIRLAAGWAKLRLRVQGPEPGAVRYALVTEPGGVVPQEGAFATLDGDEMETPGFHPGNGVVLVRAPGYGRALVRFSAAANRTTDVTVTLVPAGSVAGKLPDLSHDGPVRVRLQRFDERWPELTGAFGRIFAHSERRPTRDLLVKPSSRAFRFDDIAPGTYTLELLVEAQEGGDRTAERRVEVVVRSGQETVVSFPP